MSAPPVITSPLLAAQPGVRHAFFTRQGGVSRGVYASLNVGRGSKDDQDDVQENRRRAAAVFGLEPHALNCCYQVHSARTYVAKGPWGEDRPEGDGVVTGVRELACGVLAADCAPVLLYDPKARIVAAAHAGWQGALTGVVEAAVEAMVGLGARAGDMVAAVGPCIGPASYEVGVEFLQRFEAQDPANARFFGPGATDHKRQFDLPGFVLSRIAAAGVPSAEWTRHDTCADEARFFSNRRAFKRGEPDYGRLLSAIMLEP
ncbi:MAG TPA: peptidoglycan editing factor PgeF [Caulobacteraceae bacterium]|nr:peptidoglycan editing factor PgeF [Caulobacteraceae bacterium]